MCSATSGSSTGRLVVRLAARCDRRRLAAVADRDREVPAQPLHAGALHRAALQQRPQLVVRSLPQVEQPRAVEPARGCHAGSADRRSPAAGSTGQTSWQMSQP